MNPQSPSHLNEPEPQAGPDILQFTRHALKRSRKWILPIVVLGTLVGLYVALSKSNVYTSESKLLLRTGSRERLTVESIVSPTTDDGSANPTLQAEVQMLLDEAIYEKVARAFGPSDLLRASDPTRDDGPDTSAPIRALHQLQKWVQGGGDPGHTCTPGGCQSCISDAVEVMRQSVRLEADSDSNVIRVYVSADSPEKARRLNQSLVEAYLERHANQFSVEPILEKNRPKLEAAQMRRDAAVRQYFDHVQECGIVDLETQRRVMIEGTAATEAALALATLRHDEIRAERDALQTRMNAISSQIDLVRERAPNPKYIEMKNRVEDLDVESASNDARMQRLTTELAGMKARLDGLRECERIHATLGATRDLEEARWRELQQRFSMLSDLGQLDVAAGTNLLVLQEPTLNFKKDGPKRAKLIVAAFAFSALVAVWLALMREFFDRRLRNGPMVERQLGVRVLGTIPEYSSRDLAA